ncbi:tRNA pseudouridine synthase A [Alloscardovia theropitheci]|uniref:tRNA pseudouridine synthase A n=1 Tax=Alloscardovia theropitheci TaxID=2496842 RepID=A0A4R0QW11_9BIFI|nr:tRNA pseudouridine synthase A [Alloscardovia theropitheci]TCD53660.1 tRNA pseudouridine synthase A [Alloscardovia theropitheci]
MRLRIDLAYDGTQFHGWARQADQRTVQGEVEAAIAKVLRLDSSDVCLTVAGRTDAGVHASGQVCHIDVDDDVLNRAIGHMHDVSGTQALFRRIRRIVPDDITIYSVEEAVHGFDARFSASDRVYVYRVADELAHADPRLRNMVLRIDDTLDVEAMNEAVSSTIGLHDFGSFALPNPGGTTIREVKFARWQRVPDMNLTPMNIYHGGADSLDTQAVGADPRTDESAYEIEFAESGLLTFTIIADAFARNMVRSLVGASIAVGRGKKTVQWFADKVAHPQREGLTGPAPACGLTLERVNYPEDGLLEERANAIRAVRSLD